MALRTIAESLSEEGVAGLREMFNMIDADNSGQKTFEELKTGLKKVGANLNESEIYNLMQADGSGFIAADELQQACEEFGIEFEGARLEEMIQDIDQDNDGRIYYNEFVAMMQKGNTGGFVKKASISIRFRDARRI
ncbi:hypothetical protein SAY87_018544 [Trapa incisa]|uniref:EF-hand domain-containing protein n=1 Tax=Trapa incisa TaxID=236973 RepID=A0AAN7LCI3_9MYRT|nr:hypothetical protein SAY87_018544 [Trapa incisa]